MRGRRASLRGARAIVFSRDARPDRGQEPAQAVPEGPGRGGRGPLRRRRGGLRPARTERRREDHDARDDRGPHAAGRRRDRGLRAHVEPGRAADPGAHRRAASGDESLQQDHAAGGPRPLRQLLPEEAGDRGAPRPRSARRQGRLLSRHALRRAGPASRARPGARERSRGRLPGRAHGGPRPPGAKVPVGRRAQDEGRGAYHDAHHALHGRGRGALRPARDPRSRQDPALRHSGGAHRRPRNPERHRAHVRRGRARARRVRGAARPRRSRRGATSGRSRRRTRRLSCRGSSRRSRASASPTTRSTCAARRSRTFSSSSPAAACAIERRNRDAPAESVPAPRGSSFASSGGSTCGIAAPCSGRSSSRC